MTTDASIDITAELDHLSTVHGVSLNIEHTGGGNWIVGLGTNHGYDEEHGTDRYDVMVGPVYREGNGSFVGYGGDLYAVPYSLNRSDVTIMVPGQLLPTALSMLSIEDVTVSDPTLSLDDIADALGDGWSVSCLGGNIYGVADAHGTVVTLDAGAVSFLPAHVTIGQQLPADEEWREVWSGEAWDAGTIAEIVSDRI